MDGGIIVTSSHNPEEWNGLKFVERTGLFLSPEGCETLFDRSDRKIYSYPDFDVASLGQSCLDRPDLCDSHIQAITSLPFMNLDALRSRNLVVCLDSTNGLSEIIKSSHHHIITSTHQHINTSTYHHINTSTHHHINTSTHHQTIRSSHHQIITSTHHHIITSSHHHIIRSSDHHTTRA